MRNQCSVLSRQCSVLSRRPPTEHCALSTALHLFLLLCAFASLRDAGAAGLMWPEQVGVQFFIHAGPATGDYTRHYAASTNNLVPFTPALGFTFYPITYFAVTSSNDWGESDFSAEAIYTKDTNAAPRPIALRVPEGARGWIQASTDLVAWNTLLYTDGGDYPIPVLPGVPEMYYRFKAEAAEISSQKSVVSSQGHRPKSGHWQFQARKG